ncbi:8-amino-7-oxononanoate synthase [Flavobacterium covae]|uniref:Pyridoxal phosphate-dependent aminotransferase family protein n=1 Tax=Flavobacterium covae TaxID=2906076 RepID=A0ABW8PJS9_9FLAO|nr:MULTISPECIES: pyridoxal phosphate-dependent aminotransferase family protein [Flavobacterium]OXA81957.1 8-amino-7-oxononanoate synthase [Flavobacterium columnare NBRC 100251 = ATCC 23463]AND63766.1 8-amino-7-oxononanoate synthase [Flavobacterium covae]MCJ1807670.1 pyridoxal phosphate-dependent aminotransferase family protein [Flavobacterium covae]OWP81284.1 8-amino-7-oxononanoate synthase [Flavobacterium covae]POR22551.1 8-amino-7-oxononanoate synthase [Flavobacterium columnare]
MVKFPNKLGHKLTHRKEINAFRTLNAQSSLIDFSSNDYLGFSKSEILFDKAHELLLEKKIKINGATGSRLLTGNHLLYTETENLIAQFHNAESALIFNSGYDANVGFFESVPQRGDVILYDELCHASIRDGIRLSNAKSYKFQHNDLEELERFIQKNQIETADIYIVIESVYSMDGDSPNLEELTTLIEKYNCFLVVDEAHALGVFGDRGEGLIQLLGVEDKIFARIITFGKGLGCHGAAVLGSQKLKDYMINFTRSFIYTTGLTPHTLSTIYTAYKMLTDHSEDLGNLKANIICFNQQKQMLGIKPLFVYSKSAIQCAIVQGNDRVKWLATQLQQVGFDVKPILSPTVPEGQERLRFCLHSYNTSEEIMTLLNYFYSFL